MENRQNKSNDFLLTLLPSIAMLLLNTFVSYGVIFFVVILKIRDYKTSDGNPFDYIMQVATDITSGNTMGALFAIYSVAAVLLFGIWYYIAFIKKSGKKIQLKAEWAKLTTKPLFYIPGVILLAFGMQVLCDFLMNILATLVPSWMEFYVQLMENVGLDGEVTPLLILYVVILGPISEELIFRGLTAGYAKRIFRLWVVNVVQAVLFGAMHMNPIQSIYAFVLGLVIGYLVLKSDSLLMGMIIHITFNASSFVVSYVMPEGSKSAIEFGLLLFASMAATYVGFEMIYKNLPQAAKETSETSDK